MQATKRFRLDGEVFEVATAAEVTLRDLLLVEAEASELGLVMHMGELTRLGELFASLTPDEAKVHKDGAVMLALTIWMAKIKKLRDSGDFATRVALSEAIDVPLSLFEVLPDIPMPQDRQGNANPQKPRAKKAASARGARHAGKSARA